MKFISGFFRSVHRVRIWGLGLVVFSTLAGCASAPEPETALDGGRQFINAVYNGNFKRARQLTIADAPNLKILHERFEVPFRSMGGFDKQTLSETSIVLTNVQQQGNGGVILFYQNALSKAPDTLTVVPMEDTWRVRLDSKP